MGSRAGVKVAIHCDGGRHHSGSWVLPWVAYCDRHKIDYDLVDCYSPDFIESLPSYSVLLWHFSHYSKKDMTFARSILRASYELGVSTFPGVNDSWHFDDKVAQDYYLKAIGASIPRSIVFYELGDVARWLERGASLPVVAKLKGGSGAHNVRLLSCSEEVTSYANRMLKGEGISSSPSISFKTISSMRSMKSFSDFWGRFKRIPDFLMTLRKASSLDREHGYVYLQEFIPNDGYDLKVVVVGDKLSYICRRSRADDFRASGGGDVFYDRGLVTPEVIQLCFDTSEKIGSRCMGFDVVVDCVSNEPFIIEMSYGFSHLALLDADGWWSRDGTWHQGSLNAPDEILSSFL